MPLSEQEQAHMMELLAEDAALREAKQASVAMPAEAPPAETMLPGEVGTAEAVGRGALAGATFGFDEEAGAAFQAGLEAMRQKLQKTQAGKRALEAMGIAPTPTGTKAAGKPFAPEEEALADVYRQAREAGRMEKAKAQAAAPGAYMTGQVAGGLATGLAVGPAAATGRGAAALGAAQGLGMTEADLTRGEVGQAALETGVGGALGFAGQRAVQAAPAVAAGIGRVAEKAGLQKVASTVKEGADEALRKFAAMRFVKATGAIQKDINKETANAILKKGEIIGSMVPWSGSKAVIEQNVMAAKQAAGAAMDEALSAADDALVQSGKSFDWGKVLLRINKEVREKLSATGQRVSGASLRAGEGTYAPSFFDDIAQTAAQGGGFQAANRLKSDIADGAYSTVANKLQNRVAKKVERILNDEIEKQMKAAVGNEIGREFARAKNVYGATKLAERGLKTAAAQQGNNLFGLSEMLMGPAAAGVTAATGAGSTSTAAAGALGAAAAFATKLAKERGSAVLGRGAEALRTGVPAAIEAAKPAMRTTAGAIRQTLERDPAILGRYAQMLSAAAAKGDKELAVADYTLSNQDPEYRRMREEALKAQEE